MSTKVSVLVEIPEGWELACDEMRPLVKGEWFLSEAGDARQSKVNTVNNYIIVRKAWTWPEWCTAEEIFWDGNWMRKAKGLCCVMNGLDFTPPPDKTKSYRNPNWKEQ